MINAGNIDNDTMEGRIFRLLSRRVGFWWDAKILMRQSGSTALSTKVSGVRAQLTMRPELGLQVEHMQRKTKHFYRVVSVKKGQLELLGECA